jgi:hypothetical protein
MDPLSKGPDDTDMMRPPPAHGARVGVYTALGALSGVIALPWIPDGMARRIRGALAQDLCARHGVTLTPEARAILAEPEADMLKGAMGQALRFVALRWLRRFSPLGFLPPVRSAVTTYALGHLLSRYFARHRTERATRMDVDEAKKIRALVDKTLIELLRTDLVVPRDQSPNAPEDLRDGMTQVIDGVVIAVASLPDIVTRRLDAAFDAAVKRGGP